MPSSIVRAPILFVDHAPALGGAERSLLLLLTQLSREHWRPHLACVGGPLQKAAEAEGVITHLVSLPRLRRSQEATLDLFQGARHLARVSREIGARALYANTVRAALYTAFASRLVKQPFIWHMRDFWLSESEPTRPVVDRMGKRLLMSSATRVITNSHAVQMQLPASSKVSVIHNGIEVDEFKGAIPAAEFRVVNDIPDGASVVGMVGRLRPWKGQARFLQVAAQLAVQHPETYFIMVGGSPFAVDDDYPARLRRLAAELGLSERVRFCGHLNDVRPALAVMDIFVHPGDPEPFGLVNVEAMAMSRAVVAFAHGALPEIVEDGTTGILVEPGDEEAMARAIASLLAEPQRRKAMGEAGRNRAQALFDIRRVAREVDQLLQEVVR